MIAQAVFEPKMLQQATIIPPLHHNRNMVVETYLLNPRNCYVKAPIKLTV